MTLVMFWLTMLNVSQVIPKRTWLILSVLGHNLEVYLESRGSETDLGPLSNREDVKGGTVRSDGLVAMVWR